MIARLLFVTLIALIIPMNGDAASSSVVINEVQITEGMGKTAHDFVELFNLTNAPFNLKGHRLVKRTKTGTSDTTLKSWTADAMIPARGYYLWASSSDDAFPATIKADEWTSQTIADDNGVALRFGPEDTGAVIDSVAWGEAANALVEAAVVPFNPEEGESIARTNGADTDRNGSDFARRAPTPQHTGSAPLITPETPASLPAPSETPRATPTTETTTQESETPAQPKPRLRISELFPNPWGDDATEFIELVNDGEAAIDLAEWRIVNRAKQEYVFPKQTLAAKQYTVFERRMTGFVLQNERDEVRLLAPTKTRAEHTVSFSDAPEGLSYIPDAENDWQWTTTPTPGTTNLLVPVSQPPHIVLNVPSRVQAETIFNVDASDSFDPQGQALSYVWDFGDGLGTATTGTASYLYAKAGTYTIRVRVTKAEGHHAEATQKITVTAPVKAEEERATVPPAPYTPQGIVIPRGATKTAAATGGTTTIEGIVTAPPGVIAKTFLYLRCTTACETDGVKVRMTKAEWPELRVGDVLRVNGSWSDAGGERSFLTRKERVTIVPGRKRVMPTELSIAELTDEYLNDLVVLAGEVTEKKNTFAYLDDGAEEIRVEISDTKTRASIGEGDTIRAVGILAKDATGYKVRTTEAPTITTPVTETTDGNIPIVRPRDPKAERSRAIALALAVTLGLAVKPTYDFVEKFRKKRT